MECDRTIHADLLTMATASAVAPYQLPDASHICQTPAGLVVNDGVAAAAAFVSDIRRVDDELSAGQ